MNEMPSKNDFMERIAETFYGTESLSAISKNSNRPQSGIGIAFLLTTEVNY